MSNGKQNKTIIKDRKRIGGGGGKSNQTIIFFN